MGFTKAGGWGGAQPPRFANTRIRATFPNSEHGDDMMLVFYCTHGLVAVIFIMILILTIISTSNSNGNKNNSIGNRTRNNISNVAPFLMMGPPPPEQLPFLFNTAASPKFAAQLKSYETLESI